uniref:Uncharacterized protein n=1 Tax=Anguilla anguilla TaxID=7936 RepID=A0A0E9Q084_ANGAN
MGTCSGCGGTVGDETLRRFMSETSHWTRTEKASRPA